MKEFIELLLTKLGLGVGALVRNVSSIEDNMHLLFGEEFCTKINDSNNSIIIEYNNKTIIITYEIINERITAIAVN